MFDNATRKQIMNLMATVEKMKVYCIDKEDYGNMEILYEELKRESLLHKDLPGNEQLNSSYPFKTNANEDNEPKFSITDPYSLRKLCIDNSLFTVADNKQYDKFFEMNQNNAAFDIMVSYAYACSDDTIENIEDIFKEAKEEYQNSLNQQSDMDYE